MRDIVRHAGVVGKLLRAAGEEREPTKSHLHEVCI